jgi:CubicO group peptidase (beta-lactamase class C family)
LAADADRRQFVEKLRYLEPQFPFREKFFYQNLMFIAAGHLAETVASFPWEDLVTKEILKPLDMKRTFFTFQEAKNRKDYALGYTFAEDSLPKAMDPPDSGIGSPASGMFSCCGDMIKWIGLHLNRGKVKDIQLISTENLNEMHHVQMAIPSSPGEDILRVEGYGLGWIIEQYRENRLIRHGGSAMGFESMEAFLPEKNLGVVVLCNTQETLVPDLLMRNIVDLMLGMEPVNFFNPIKRRKKARIEKDAAPKRSARIPSPSELEKYAGKYKNPAYGTAVIQQENDRLKMNLNGRWEGDLEYSAPDLFLLTMLGFRDMRVIFDNSHEGETVAFRAKLDPEAKPIEFIRSVTH